MKTSKHITIFEGPDGSGKTTIAKRYAELTGARYVHFGPLPQVRANLARLYIEAMLPALLGYQHVVLDRCWLSEFPYGTIYRPEQPLRVEGPDLAMLERVAMRCGAVVVQCAAPWDAVEANFSRRQGRGGEMLDNANQLNRVYAAYLVNPTQLPRVFYDYTGDEIHDICYEVQRARGKTHPLSMATAGNWDASTVLVGEGFGSIKDVDPLQQYPFVSFSRLGCSQWLTAQLDEHSISERDLVWINADDLGLERFFDESPVRDQIIALGNKAGAALTTLKLNHVVVPHPQHQKRFNGKHEYNLFKILRGEH